MTADVTDVTDAADWRRSAEATGLLRIFNDAGAIEASDVLVAQRLTALGNEPDERVALAVAFVVRAVRGGSVCMELASVREQVENDDLPWPAPAEWLAAVAASPLLGSPAVLHLEDDLLYFDRYWLEERQVATDLLALMTTRPQSQSPDIARLFPKKFEEQRRVAEVAMSRGLTVLTGGPGTGKTTTVARLLALLAEQAELADKPRPRIALAAPTGKAAARLREAVQTQVDELEPIDRARLEGLRATTLHRLLGSLPRTSARFRHHRANRLPHDVIVVDETSMVSLTMMARLVEAVRPDSRLLLVGDPDQLASVEAGAVLADLVEGLSARHDSPVVKLIRAHRFGPSIGALASAIRVGDANRAIDVLNAGGEHIEWIDTEEPTAALRTVLVPQALRLRAAAVLGNGPAALATLEEHRLLCAHRRGPHGVAYWNRQVERWLAEETDAPLWTSWYAGRPVLVTANDYGLRLYNGDVGVTVMRDGVLRVVMAGADGLAEYSTGRLADIETMHAMTIHKSQGSQVDEVTVLLPQTDSRLLTRELLYTAVTRAQTKVRVVGSAEQLRAAVGRRAARATGLSRRLQG
ncbi:exodeoxyribonuclease V subunit alpha [Mycolicibacterium sp. Dal123E01]|uniref:exodeoxyribonuclease V subunit alpha n=1 Tax=Mycolicibacterium sp. Dal123E01 TaxID=3457578 RepID=UPI00403EAFDC